MRFQRLQAAVVATALAVSPAFGQFGIQGGINLTRSIGDDVSNVEASQGLNAGGLFRLFDIGPIRSSRRSSTPGRARRWRT